MKQTFMTSFLTFYMKASITLEGNYVKTSNPNTILKLIPLGSTNKTIPINQIASVNDTFTLDIKSFLWGLVFAIGGLVFLGTNFLVGLIVAAYGVLTALSSFQTVLHIHMTNGKVHDLNAVIFEKGKLHNCSETILELISDRYHRTETR